MPIHKVRKIIQVHPPEADAVAKVFDDSCGSVQTVLDHLKAVDKTLTQEWEGHQKNLFLENFEKTIVLLQTHLLSGLDINKRKYKAFSTDKVIEVIEHY